MRIMATTTTTSLSSSSSNTLPQDLHDEISGLRSQLDLSKARTRVRPTLIPLTYAPFHSIDFLWRQTGTLARQGAGGGRAKRHDFRDESKV